MLKYEHFNFIKGVMKRVYFQSKLRNLHSIKLCIYIKI